MSTRDAELRGRHDSTSCMQDISLVFNNKIVSNLHDPLLRHNAPVSSCVSSTSRYKETKETDRNSTLANLHSNLEYKTLKSIPCGFRWQDDS